MIRALAPWLLALAGGLLLALSFGFVFPESNQNTYLVHGLTMHDPSLFPRDWYVREATDYHHAFSVLVALLFALHDGPQLFVVLDVALLVAGALAWFVLTRRLFGPWVGALAYAAWLGLGMLTKTSDVMASYAFGGYLQPSSIGIAGYLWALALFACADQAADRRSLLLRLAGSGGALAVASAFHLNFLVLGVATLGLAHVARARGRVWARDFWIAASVQMALPAVVLLWALPQLLEATRGPTAQALPILFTIRAPHHFRPTLVGLLPCFAWQAAAWIVVLTHRRSARAVPAPLVHLLAGIGGFVVVASLLSTVVQVPQVTQTFPWRLAPVASGLALVTIVGTALRCATPEPLFQEPRTTLARIVGFLVAGGLAVFGASVAWWQPERGRLYLVALALAVLAAVVGGRVAGARGRPQWAARLSTALVVLVVVAGARVALRDASLDIQGLPKSRLGVIAWALRDTPTQALFAVPPEFESFRLASRRSVVVDWKSAGMLPNDIVAWARRMEDVSGTPLRSRNAARQGYARMTATRALSLGERYGVDYFVFDKRLQPLPAWGTPAFEDARYLVLPLPDRAAATGNHAPAAAGANVPNIDDDAADGDEGRGPR